jgi:hypothetical protein
MVSSFEKNATRDSAILTLSDGTRLAVRDSVGGGGGGGVTTMAAIGATPNANGATISGSTLNLEPASASFGGVVTTGAQTFAGNKTFTGIINHGASLGNAKQYWYDGGAGSRWGVGMTASGPPFVQFFSQTANNGWTWNGGGDLQTLGTNEYMRLSSVGLIVNVPFSVPSLNMNSAAYGIKLQFLSSNNYGIGINAFETQNFIQTGGIFTWNGGGTLNATGVNEWLRVQSSSVSSTTASLSFRAGSTLTGNVQSQTPQNFLRLIRPVSGGLYYPGVADINVYAYGAPDGGFTPQTQLDIRLKSDGTATEAANVDVLSLTSNQRVGIATTTPAATLAVNGNAIIGGNTAAASAILNVQSTTKGFLPPRMTTAEKNAISSPAAGLIVYDTTLNKLCVFTTVWETITSL